MLDKREVAVGAVLFLAAIVLVVVPRPRLSAAAIAAPQTVPSQAEEPVPAFHSELPPGPLPQTLDPSLFNEPVVRNAYRVASKVKKVLYKQPCYCHCDRSQGHGSLLDCFVSRHASVCDVCIREDFYSYEQTMKGRAPEQIRTGIKQGEWHKVDIAKYQTYPSKP